MQSLLNKIKEGREKLSDLTPFWESVGMYMIKQTIQNFEYERSPDGVKWKPLSPSTIKRRMKRSKKGRFKILQDTGELRRSIAYKAFKNKVIFGSNLVYAATHQFGRGKIPARSFLGVTDENKQKALSMLKIYLKNSFSN